MYPLNRHQLLAELDNIHVEPPASADNNPFNAQGWWAAYLAHVVDDQTVCWRVGNSTALFGEPMDKRGELRALTNYYTGLFTLGSGTVATPADFCDSFVRVSPAFAALSIEPLDAEDAKGWCAALRKHGWVSRTEVAFVNWYQPARGLSYQSYLAGLDTRTQNTLKRRTRAFQKLQGNSIEIFTGANDLARGIEAFEQVYKRSWKPVESHPAFIRAWIEQCAHLGWLRLGVAWTNGNPIAAQIWFCAFGVAYIFKLAYDESYSAHSPGTVLTGALFRHVLDTDNVTEVDFLSGNDTYKSQWMKHKRLRMRVTAAPALSWRGLKLLAESSADRLRALSNS